MKRLIPWFSRIAGLARSPQRESALAAEVDSHIAMHVEDKMRAGLTAEQARREAILQLVGLERTKQAYRDRSTIPLVEAMFRDLRFALRQLRKNSGFAFTAILMLALGICANVAIFSFVDAVLMKPLPYRNPARLVSLYESNALGSQHSYRLCHNYGMAVRTTIDLPEPLHDQLRHLAERSGTSIRSLIVRAIEQTYPGTTKGHPVTGPLIRGTGKRGPHYPSDENPHDVVFS
jgi:hypothetical protein